MRFRGAGETRQEVVEISRDHRLLTCPPPLFFFLLLLKSKHVISNQGHHNGGFFCLNIYIYFFMHTYAFTIKASLQLNSTTRVNLAKQAICTCSCRTGSGQHVPCDPDHACAPPERQCHSFQEQTLTTAKKINKTTITHNCRFKSGYYVRNKTIQGVRLW